MTILFVGGSLQVTRSLFALSPAKSCGSTGCSSLVKPERPRLEQIVEEHNLVGCVELTGQKPAEVGELMSQAEILAFSNS